MSSLSRISRATRCPVAPDAAHVDHQPQRIVGVDAGAADDPVVEHVEPGDRADPLAQLGERGDRLGEQLLAVDRRLAAGGVERGGQERVRARRLDQGHGAVEDPLVDAVPAIAEVQDRRLGDRADDLVHRGEDHVGAALERRRRQRRGEVQVRAPGLVDDQRHAARVRDLGQRRDVGDGAEVGRRDDHRRDRVRLGRERRRRAPPGSGSGRRPSSGSSSGATNRGRRPESTSPSMIEEWTLRWTTTRSPVCASARQIAWLPPEPPLTRNQLRFAPQASAASRWACWNGASAGSGATSIPSTPAGMSSSQHPLAERLAQRRVGPGAALVPGDVEAAGVAIGVLDQRVEVGGRVLLHGRPR